MSKVIWETPLTERGSTQIAKTVFYLSRPLKVAKSTGPLVGKEVLLNENYVLGG